MISIEVFEFIVAAFCSFKDPKVSLEYKEECVIYMSNCSLRGTDGKTTTNENVNYCKERWAEKHKKYK